MRSQILCGLLLAALTFVPLTSEAQAQDAPAAQAVAASTAYKLGPGDKIRVITYGEDKLTGEFLVDGSGMISLPLVGSLKVGDLTPQQLQTVVETQLKQGYIKEPRVSVEVLTFRPFYILGEVNKPGTYPYTNGLTVLNAVATASGFTYRANTKRVYIKHLGEATEDRVPLTPSLAVAPGDTIRISERFF